MPSHPLDPDHSTPHRPARPEAPPSRSRPAIATPNKPPEPIKATTRIPRRHPAHLSARAQILRRLYLRRTFIPIMLTLGVLFCGIGAVQWMSDPDYPFAARNMTWCAIGLPVVGGVLLILAAVNIMYVREKLRGLRTED
jgi:hypothetical protein